MTLYLGAPEPFNASNDDWQLYVQRFEHFLLANKISDSDEKCHLLLALMGAPTFKLLANLAAPKQPGELKFKDICDILKKHYSPQPIKIAERYRFYNRKQLLGESAAKYFAQLRKMANTCSFGTFLDEALCDRLVCGIRDQGMQHRLLAEADLTLKKAFDLIQGMEAADKNAQEMQKDNNFSLHTTTVSETKAKKLPCSRCLGIGHSPHTCRFKTAKCNKCHKLGHLARACHSPQPVKKDHGNSTRQMTASQPSKGQVRQVTDDSKEEVPDIVHVHTVREGLPGSYKVMLEVNKQPIEMELDTGAIVSLISEATWRELHKPALESCPFVLKGYPDNKLDILGMCKVEVTTGGVTKQLPLVVCKGRGVSLLGRNWLQELQLNWQEIAKINGIIKDSTADLNKLLKQFDNVFRPELGHCKEAKAKLYLKEGAVPKFNRPRTTAIAMKARIEEELNRQEKLGILEKIDTAEWAAPVVPVIKPSGAIRLCGDYKVSINPHLEVNKYPLSHPEEIFTALNGGEKFTKLDLSEAYLQIALEEQSRNLVVINTHKGLYRFTRLPYGVASAPAIFQQIMDQILPQREGIICYLDDILITGKNNHEHLQNLEAVLKRLEEYNLRIKKPKCCFFQDKVEFLGKVVTKEGIAASSGKVEAVLKIPPPQSLTQLRSFLGIVNHYRKFVPLLADLSDPLNHLLKKDTPWEWSSECQESFTKLKEALTSTTVLAHYDPMMPIALACDASSIEIGAVIYHVDPDGKEKPIAYESKTLSNAERKYSQIEREALSIIFGVKKFHTFLYG